LKPHRILTEPLKFMELRAQSETIACDTFGSNSYRTWYLFKTAKFRVHNYRKSMEIHDELFASLKTELEAKQRNSNGKISA
jgi:hypothetical protein